MAEPKKTGFWNGLFRTRSKAGGSAKLEKERRSDPGPPPPAASVQHRRPPRRQDGSPRHVAKDKGKGREQPNDGRHVYEAASPLSRWPPSGMASAEELTLGRAMELIARGVPVHKGHRRAVAHAPDSYYALYATTAGNHGDETDGADLHDAMTQLSTLRIRGGAGPPNYPWETLEQPSQAFACGARPGTVTLNAWVSRSSALPPTIALRDAGVVPRPVELSQVFHRLKDLETGGLEDDSEEALYKLYRRFLRDPSSSSSSSSLSSPRRRMEQQITDLVLCLSGPDWIDFTVPKNQVVTKFIFDTSGANHEQYLRFFYQLLLSLELELRINSRLHRDDAKERLLGQIPPKIQWNLALARRWRDNVRVEQYGRAADQVRFRFKLRKRQTKMLKRFAQMMKWPNLAETVDTLKQRGEENTLVSISSHAMAFFSGLVLPGPTFPFLMMNSLVDVDPDEATDDLALLTHLHPSCGFQYRGSHTYWTSGSVVGKVLAPTCREAAGWVGPARPTPDLAGSQIARVRARPPPPLLDRLLGSGSPRAAAEAMGRRSDPLGPAAEVYPAADYALLAPDVDGDAGAAATVRVELLQLKPLLLPPGGGGSNANANANGGGGGGGGGGRVGGPPQWFDASLRLAIDGEPWLLSLAHDVCFVHAWPCSGGPHPLFLDYAYTPVRADEVVHVRDWAKRKMQLRRRQQGRRRRRHRNVKTRNGEKEESGESSKGEGAGDNKDDDHDDHDHDDQDDNGDDEEDDDPEGVLVIKAFGESDYEVLARAWCAHWGLHAVVADLGSTCLACAIREAYAATLTVVILVEGELGGSE
ncbi:hypothetical protein GGR56DRAFT_679911 [Xylariaceae sp. FL0804]|nr:hypothetical protein GGR56DRAFT_679911 [Xylariaceae sp. FL0804]